MKKILLIITSSLTSYLVVAQTVVMIDKTSLQPIQDMQVFTTSKSAISSSEGKIDIQGFPKNEPITFKHASYKQLTLSYQDLEAQNFTVKMTESVLKIAEIVVSSNRWEQNKEQVPSRITTILPIEIQMQNPQTTADMLETSGEVFIQKSQLGGGSPMIRGFSSNRILIMVDGVRMNNAIYRSGNLQNVISLDANNIKNSELIFGPGSVIYGSDAIGGVMDFHTLDAKLATNKKFVFKANSLVRHSTANGEKTAHLDLNFGFGKIGFLTGVTYSDFDDLKMGNWQHDDYTRKEYVEHINEIDEVLENKDINIQKHTAYKQINLMQKIKFDTKKYWNLQYGFHYSRLSDVPRYDRLIQYKNDKLKYAQWYYGPQKWMMNTLNVKYNKLTKLSDRVKIILAHQKYEESRHNRKFGKDDLQNRTEKVKAISLNLDVDKQLSNKTHLFYGADIQHNDIDSKGETRNIETGKTKESASRYPDGSKYSSYAAYINLKYLLNKKTTLIAGARYSRILLHSKFNNKFHNFPFQEIEINTGAVNASVGFVFKPSKDFQLNINTASGFRAPNIDDVGKIFDSEPGNVVVPNKDLHSEYAYNFEVGIIKTLFDNVKLDMSGFYTILTDAMVRRDYTFDGKTQIMYDDELSNVQALVNTDNAKVWGVQLGVYADIFENVSIKSNINYSKGEDNEGLPVRHVAPLFGRTHLMYSVNKFKINLYSVYNGQIENKNMAISEKNKTHMYAKDSNGLPYSPAWATFNIKMKYQINKYACIDFGIENITNLRYRPYSSGIVSAGRNFIFAIRANI